LDLFEKKRHKLKRDNQGLEVESIIMSFGSMEEVPTLPTSSSS